MIRSVYCPSEAHLEEAMELAEQFKLPIIVGECEQLNGTDFDKKSVSVVSVPNAHYLEIFTNPVRAGFAQSFKYTNDFKNLTDIEISVYVTCGGITEKLNIQFLEKHCFKCVYRSFVTGMHTITVYVEGVQTAEAEYEVII